MKYFELAGIIADGIANNMQQASSRNKCIFAFAGISSDCSVHPCLNIKERFFICGNTELFYMRDINLSAPPTKSFLAYTEAVGITHQGNDGFTGRLLRQAWEGQGAGQ